MTGTVQKGLVLREDLDLYDGIDITSSRTSSTGGSTSGLRINDWVDVISVYGDGENRTGSVVQDAINAIGSSTNVALALSPGTWTFDTNLTIASNFTLFVPAGCVLAPESGITLTIQGVLFRMHATYTGGDGTVTVSGTDILSSSDDTDVYAADTGSPNTYAIDVGANPASYAAGQVYRFKAGNANTGASTLNVDSLGAVSIVKQASAALEANDIRAGDLVTVVHDGSNFQLQSHPLLGDLARQDADDLAGTGLTANSGALDLDIDGLTEETSIQASADYVPVYDATASANRKVKPENLGFNAVLTHTATASSDSSLDFTALSSTYHAYLIVFDRLLPATDAVNLYLRTSTDNGSSFDSGSGNYNWAVLQSLVGTEGASGSNGDTEIQINKETIGSGSGEGISGRIVLYDPSASAFTKATWEVVYRRASNQDVCAIAGGGMREDTTAVDAVQLLFSSGNIASGEVRVYGLKDA